MAAKTQSPDLFAKQGAKSRKDEEVLHEFPAVDKYRVRVLRKSTARGELTSLDIREYVDADKFQGFTRRGVRINRADDVKSLYAHLGDALQKGWLDARNGNSKA